MTDEDPFIHGRWHRYLMSKESQLEFAQSCARGASRYQGDKLPECQVAMIVAANEARAAWATLEWAISMEGNRVGVVSGRRTKTEIIRLLDQAREIEKEFIRARAAYLTEEMRTEPKKEIKNFDER